uniref:Centrosomal protein 131 n=1 Tax=Callorhinchus milii TaxID=7868 RepID=A0A4W3JYT0_CALMI
MNTAQSCSSFLGDELDLSLTGSQLLVSKRPSSASPAKILSRSTSVALEKKPKRNVLGETSLGNLSASTSRAINNLRRSNSTTQVSQRGNGVGSEERTEDFLALFDSSASGRKKLCSLSKVTPERKTTWNILDEEPRVFVPPTTARSASTTDTPVFTKKRESSVSLAANFTANNRSNKGAVGNSVTTMLHNNYSTSEKPLAPKSSNQKATSLNNDENSLDQSSLKKSQKNLSSNNVVTRNNTGGMLRRKEVTEEEAERFIEQVNLAAVTIQRWYRRHIHRRRASEAALRRMLSVKKQREREMLDEGAAAEHQRKKSEERKKIREEKARQARKAAIQVMSPHLLMETKLDCIVESHRAAFVPQARELGFDSQPGRNLRPVSILQPPVAVSRNTVVSLLEDSRSDRLLSPQDTDSTSLTADNLERLGKIELVPGLPEAGTLLSEAKLQSIMSFLDEMERSEQERPHSAASAELAHLEQASAVATEVTSSMMRLKLELEEKKRAMSMLQTALNQQRELTVRHVKETEKEMKYQLRLQKEQYEATIQRHLAFIDQLIDDKKGLSEKCESMVNELKIVDQKYMAKIQQIQEQHGLEIKKLKEVMSATEKVRREKWIDEKTKKIKEITVKGLEPEIQKLIAKQKQEIKKLRALHEAELLQSDERAAQRYVRQTEELREQLEREKEELCQRERELARQRLKQLEQEEHSLQQQRRRLYAEVAEEKERLNQNAVRQRAELEELRRQLESNCSLATKALREEFDKTKEEQERRHQVESRSLKERLDIEKQAWEENFMKKQEAWLLTRERELKEELRRGRDREIELVIQRLEEETSTSKDECERVAENRIKRVREKYESEFRDLERSERALQERYNELRARLMESEGENARFQGLFRQKEQEVEDIRKIKDRLTEERNSLAEVIRQEFADRLVMTEEENKRLKTEMSEGRARHRLEVERVTREKEEELEEKEEAVSNLRKQHEVSLC